MAKRRAFTLVEVLITVATIAVLVSIAIPALAGARATFRGGKCLANLRSIATVQSAFVDENRRLAQMDELPEDVQALRCPSARRPDEGGYITPIGFGGMGLSATTWFGRTQVQNPARVVVVNCYRHDPDQCGFLDGHAQ